MLYYSNQPAVSMFNAATLTAAYTGNRKSIETGGFSKLSIDVSYTMGAAETGNTMEFQLEASHDGTTWYTLVIDSTTTISAISARAWQMSQGNLNVLVDIAYRHVRVSLKETGVAVNYGSASMTVTLSGL